MLDGIRILVVDDNPINRAHFAHSLRRHGAIVTTVCDGDSALVVAGQHAFDALVMDLRMPGHSGEETLSTLRASGQAASNRAPAVAVTASAERRARCATQDSGFAACLIKPIDGEALAHTLQTAIAADREHETPVWDDDRATAAAGGDAELARELVHMLVVQLPDQLAAVEAAVHAHAWEKARELSHKLAGSAAYCAAPALQEAALALEEALAAGRPPIDRRRAEQRLHAAAQSLIKRFG